MERKINEEYQEKLGEEAIKHVAEVIGVSEGEAHKKIFGRNKKEWDEVVCLSKDVVTIRQMLSQYMVFNEPFSQLSEKTLQDFFRYFPREAPKMSMYRTKLLEMDIPNSEITYKSLIEIIESTDGDINSLEEHVKKEDKKTKIKEQLRSLDTKELIKGVDYEVKFNGLVETLLHGEDMETRLLAASKFGELKDNRAISHLIEGYEKDEDDSKLIDGSWSEPSKAHYLHVIADIGGEKAKEYLFGLFQGKYPHTCSSWTTLKCFAQLCNKDNACEIADFLIENYNRGEKWMRERVNNFFHCYGASLVKYEDARKKLQDYAREKDEELNKSIEIAIRKKYEKDLHDALRSTNNLEKIVAVSNKLCEMGYAKYTACDLTEILGWGRCDDEYMELKRRVIECIRKSKLTFYNGAREILRRSINYINTSPEPKNKHFAYELRKILEEDN